MANPFFRFKQFTVWHDKCAMKVGTDGVLLGCWCDVPEARTILDVGCGTGLISLMLAQRIPAQIDAIDIDESACIQARENVSHSPFSDRIHIIYTSLARFAQTNTGKTEYDCIVSNPPYFIDSLKCPDKQRTMARHTDTLPLDQLIHDSKRLLSPSGCLCLVLPFDQRDALLRLVREEGLHLQKETDVYPTPASQPKRLLVQVGRQACEYPQMSSLVIEKERHHYTDEFIALAKEYYLYL